MHKLSLRARVLTGVAAAISAMALGVVAAQPAAATTGIPVGFGFVAPQVAGFPTGAVFLAGGGAYDPSTGFVFVDSFDEALERAVKEAAGRNVGVGGGADVIRQALTKGVVDELAISVAPVVLGGGKRLFDGFTKDVDLEILTVHHSPYATHTRYAVVR